MSCCWLAFMSLFFMSVLILMMSITPRKRRNFSLEEKVEIIRDLESGISQTRLASSKEIPRSTVQNIWSNRHKILAEFDTYLTEIKKARLPDFEEVNSIVLRWFQQRARSDSVPSEAILRVRAEQFAELYNRTDFKADYKWLSRWKIKYDINMPVNEPHKEMKRNGTRENDSPISLNLFEDIWPHFLIGYTPDNIYCAGKIGFFYRVLPDKIHTFKNEKCNSGNHAVERLTMLLCCSIDGVDRRKPLIVGKFKNPRAFKSVKNRRHLPIDYHWSSKSWMTSQVLSSYTNHF